jgi:putative phosphonate catabolism associated alcohol dehydrogenase
MQTKSKAAIMISPNTDLKIMEYPLPKVEPGCILVEISCCTICGSDLHTWQGRRKSPIPIILGHEIVGKILELGNGVTHDSGDQPLNVGDRITWTIMDNCGKCFYCREKGLMMKCRSLRKYGHDSCEDPPHLVGGFAEHCYITPGTCVVKIPENLSDEEVAPANCTLSTAVAALEALKVQPFENILIQGAGALCFYASALASHYGCKQIIVTDILDKRSDAIKKFGATKTINTKNMETDEVIDTIASLTNGYGVDCAIEAAGLPSLIPLGLKSLRIGGRYAVVGVVFNGADFSYDAGDIVFRMLNVMGVHNYDAKHLQMGVDFLSQTCEEFPFKEITSHRTTLENINQGLQAAASGDHIRVAVCP